MALRVGLIGASPNRGWGRAAHAPALKAVPGMILHAVATGRPATVDAARTAFEVPLAFANPFELIAHPDIDLVSVAVKVPEHRALVMAALAAGKHVYCEWPLGNGLAEAEALAEAARQAGVHAAIGLQGRASPTIGRVRALVAQGYVGRVLSTSVVASGEVFGAEIDAANAYLQEERFGATLLTIQFGHFADAVCHALGEFESLSATLATRYPEVRIKETGAMIPSTSPDQVAVTGVLAGGAVAALHLRGGHSPGTNLLWEINGTEGCLQLSDGQGFVHFGAPGLRGARQGETALSPIEVEDDGAGRGLPVPAGNVARAYALLAQDIRDGTRLSPGFDAAVVRHRMIEAIRTAAATGMRQELAAPG